MENGKSVSRKARSVCDHSTRERTEARDRSGCLRSRSSQVPTGFTSRMAHSDETQKSKAEKLAKAAREPVPGRGPEATCGFLAETWWQDERRVALSELRTRDAPPHERSPRAEGGADPRPDRAALLCSCHKPRSVGPSAWRRTSANQERKIPET